ELRLDEVPPQLHVRRVRGDFFKLSRIVVSTERIECLRARGRPNNVGGRPTKRGGVKVLAYLSAHIQNEEGNIKKNELIAHDQENSLTLPASDRIGLTTITGLVEELLKAMDNYPFD